MSEVNFSFSTSTGDQTLIYTFVMRDGSPIKLGDGTFGSVFHVEGEGKEQAVVKIFYETKDDTTRLRYKEEMESGEKVRSALGKEGLRDLEGHLVLSTSHTEDFTSSPAFTALTDCFKRAQLSISKYALVMPLYACTLKDLLERGAPARRLIDAKPMNEPGLPGYEILQGLSYPDRERCILPFIRQIARGLLALHAAQFHHHDLKPANIFVKSSAGDLVAAVADLGFLNPNLTADTTLGRFSEALPLGTRYYRSPEQRDYFDICEVDVEAAGPEEPILLMTRDRKFMDTLIEPGDMAVFSKDPRKTPRKIAEIKHDKERKESIITLESQVIEYEKDVRTQVILYKTHTARTDVFGLGAIIYDLLTCGRSPESFYDFIRLWDRRGDRDSGDRDSGDSDRSVDTLVEQYNQLTKSQTTYPALATAFQSLQHDKGGYPSTEIVTILLRCMLPVAENSYAKLSDTQSQGTSNERIAMFLRIIRDLEQGMDRLSAWSWDNDRNPLWVGEKMDGLKGPSSDVNFPKKLNELQEVKPEELGKRLVLAYRLLRKIVQAAENTERSHEVFLAQFSPNYLLGASENEVMRCIGTIYRTEADYLQRIATGGNFNVPNDPRDRFVPPGLTFDSRPVLLSATASPPNPPSDYVVEDGICYAYRYRESCPFWRGLEPDDVLLILSDRKRIPTTILRVVGNQVWIQRERAGELLRPGLKLDAIAIKKLKPVDYYLSMIGIYIHQLFFVDSERDTGTLPDAIWLFQQAKSCTPVERLTSLAVPQPLKPAKNATGPEALFDYLARLYAWLVCMDYREKAGVTYDGGDVSNLFGHVGEALDKIRGLVAQVVEIHPPHLLDAMSDDNIEKKDWVKCGALQDYSTLNDRLLPLVKGRILDAFAPDKGPGIFDWLFR